MAKSDLEMQQLVHFSHDHPLVLTNMTEAGHECFGCNSTAAGCIYRCNPCNFDLHLSCSEIPLQIKHPFDAHPLILLARPLYEGGIFKCDACGQDSKGFPFHCNICQTDLHPSCANLPLQFNHPNHPHTLGLSFTPPYPQKVFSCDVCNKSGKDSWHYHCSHCFFDVHVTCINVTSQSNRNPNLPAPSRSITPANSPIMASRSMTAANSPINIMVSRSITAASSLINSLINTPHNMPTGIPQRPSGPYRPAMFSQMPLPQQYAPTGTAIRPPINYPTMFHSAASRPPVSHPTMFHSAASIPPINRPIMSQIRPTSYQSTVYNRLLHGAATAARDMITGNNHGSTAGSELLDSSENYNNNVDSSNAVDFNNQGDTAGSGFLDSSGNYNNNLYSSNAVDFNNSGYAGSGSFDYSSSVGSGIPDSSGNYYNNVDNSNAVNFNNSGDAGSGAFDYSSSVSFDYSTPDGVDYSSSAAFDYNSSTGGFDASGFQGDF